MDPQLTVSLDLVRLAQDGDKAALNRLIDRYQDRVKRIVRMRLGRKLRDGVDSGDILQETFMAAVKSFDAFEMREESSLINWLSKLAERQIIAAADFHGAKKRDIKRNVPLSPPSTADGTERIEPRFGFDETHPLERMEKAESSKHLEQCLADLPEEYRELVILRDYTGASWEEVAKETGRPSAAAARMMHARALVELGKRMRERG